MAATRRGGPPPDTRGAGARSKPASTSILVAHARECRFAAATGSSPARWLLEQRVAAGAALLERSDAPVEHVGALVGIPSPAAFRRHFARVMGVPPSAYRRAFAAR